MENRAYAFAVGVFTLLLGAGVVVAAMWLSGETDTFETFTLETRHPVTGLNVQAPVRFRGVDVGKVESIAFSAGEPQRILVRIAVRAGTPLTRGTYGTLGSQGVTGLSYVILDDDGSRPERVASADPELRIPMRPSFLDEISGSGRDLLTDVRQVAARVNALLDEKNQAQLIRTLAGLESATNRISALAAKLDPAVEEIPGLAVDARKAFTRAEELIGNLNRLTLELTRHVDAIERVARSAEQVGGAVQSVSTAATGQTLPRVNELVEELARTSRSLDRLLGELSEQPASLVFGRPRAAPGPGEPGFNPGRGEGKR
ncbi:MAG: MCE family protein [Burkholderiales bacterium]|nr:MCE family protein [Burkholderiales bacterium]